MRASAIRIAATGACALPPLLAHAAPLHPPAFHAPRNNSPMLLEPDAVVYDPFQLTFRHAFGDQRMTSAQVAENFAHAPCVYIIGQPLKDLNAPTSYPQVAGIRHDGGGGLPLAAYRFRNTP